MAGILRVSACLPLVGNGDSADNDGMFKVHCPKHGSDVLLFGDNIESLHNRRTGTELRWVCTCGQRGKLVTRRADRRSMVR